VSGPVLVTGAAGFAGSHVVQALVGRGDIVAWYHASPAPAEIERLATSICWTVTTCAPRSRA
jgi:nucleoside-diphosphate-sugar epimerase